MMAIDDEMLMAYLDGELEEIRRARVEQALNTDPDLRERLERQSRLRRRLTAHYAPVAEEPVPERFRTMLNSKVADLGAMRVRRPRPLWQSFAAIAATLVLGIALGQTLPKGAGPIAVEDGTLIARGPLAQALETQLASSQAPDAETRIGVTFAHRAGRLCRTFEDEAMAGLACRRDGDWEILITAAQQARGATAYRQAGSGNGLVLQAAQEMMAGEPLDAVGEQEARDSGWRNPDLAD